MDNVTIQCGNCNNLIAISREHLGQQVRCPLCQAVIMAPAPEATEPQQPSAFGDFSQSSDDESIFDDKKESDDIFGEESAPAVEMPPENPPEPPADPWGRTSESSPATEASPGFPNMELGETSPESNPFAPEGGTETYSPPTEREAPLLPPQESSPPGFPESEPTEAPADDLPRPALQPRRPQSRWSTWLLPGLCMWFITSLILILYMLNQINKYKDALEDSQEELERMPDIDGDNQGTRKLQEARARPRTSWKRPLPDRLKFALGETIDFGDLQVTPLRVERDPIEIKTEGFSKSIKPNAPALKLYLRLKNVSQDLVFAPLDPYYVRRYRGSERDDLSDLQSQGKLIPHTFLKITQGDRVHRFFGGPTMWADRSEKGKTRDYIVGQELNRFLKPGEEMETFIAADPEHGALTNMLDNLRKDARLLWRVRVRRGSVTVDGKRRSASAVFGVRFKPSDIKS